MGCHIRPVISFLISMTLLTGLLYPLGITVVAQLLFPEKANGSLLTYHGLSVGSELIGQSFSSDKYFHGRPSATTATDPNDPTKTIPSPYNAANSGGSNLGPTSQALINAVKTEKGRLQAESDAIKIPVDLVTASGSGLDPHITPAAALFQIPRVAKARHLSEAELNRLVEGMTEGRSLGVIGEPIVNVLKLNLALDNIAK